MTPLRLAPFAFALAVMAGCASEPTGPGPVVHDNGMTGMSVTGRDGLQFNRVIRFGEYRTSVVGLIVSKSMSTGPVCTWSCNQSSSVHLGPYRKEYEQHYNASQNKYTFQQDGPEAMSAVVHVINQRTSQSRSWTTSWFGLPTAVDDVSMVDTNMLGTIDAPDNSRPGWRFGLIEGSAQQELSQAAGWLVDDGGRRVVLRHRPMPPNVPTFVARLSHGIGPGFDFEMDGQRVGSVDLMPPNVVWMKDGLPPDVRLALAGFSSAVLLRPRED